jgi:hypothetical protein
LSADTFAPVSTPETKAAVETFECREYIDIDSIEQTHLKTACNEIVSNLFNACPYGLEKQSLLVGSNVINYRERAINQLLHQADIEYKNTSYHLTISKRIQELLKRHFRLTLEKILEKGLFGSAEKVIHELNESIKNGSVYKTIRNEYELIQTNDYDDEIGEVKDYEINQDIEELKERVANLREQQRQSRLINDLLAFVTKPPYSKKKPSLRFKPVTK